MRDRETDSWWSIMRSAAIGGPLEGRELIELPYGTKTTWGEWKVRHPTSRVLSIDGREHEARNPYEEYFASDETFRDLEITDKRLPPKTPVFAFWIDGRPVAAAYSSFAGGRIFSIEGADRKLALFRDKGAPLFASTRAFWIDLERAAASSPAELLALIESAAGSSGGAALDVEPVPGIDTFWYNWVAVNDDSVLLD